MNLETGVSEQGTDIDPEDVRIAYAAVIENPAKRIETLLEIFQTQGVHIEALTRTINDACEHIEALEDLLEEWKKFGERVGETRTDCKSVGFLIDRTAQLLGEEDQDATTNK